MTWACLCPLVLFEKRLRYTAHGHGQGINSVAWHPPCPGPTASPSRLRDAGFKLPLAQSGGWTYLEWDSANLGIGEHPPLSYLPPCGWREGVCAGFR